MAEKYRELFEKFVNLFHSAEYERMQELFDPNLHWEIKGVPAFSGTYNLQKLKEFNKKMHEATQGKMKVKLHELLVENKQAMAHFTHELTLNDGKRMAYDAIWILELNREGTKILKGEVLISADPNFFAFAETIKKAA